jgi:hypothetical protein
MIDRRKFMRLERALLAYRPRSGPPVPPKPADADAILGSLALFHKPGDRVGVRTMAEEAGVPLGKATATRLWAKASNIWPYIDEKAGYGSAAERAKKGGKP